MLHRFIKPKTTVTVATYDHILTSLIQHPIQDSFFNRLYINPDSISLKAQYAFNVYSRDHKTHALTNIFFDSPKETNRYIDLESTREQRRKIINKEKLDAMIFDLKANRELCIDGEYTHTYYHQIDNDKVIIIDVENAESKL